MNHADNEKRKLEEQASRIFCQWYARHYHCNMRFSHSNSPAKPDTTCLLDGHPIDIEIAHLYGSQQEAMQILGKELDQTTLDELDQMNQSSDPHQRLLNALNRILFNKAQKHYDSASPWLVIRNAHPAWQANDIRQQCQHIQLLNQHPFSHIWIIGDWQGYSGVVPLYP